MSVLHFSEFTASNGTVVTTLTPTVGLALLALGSSSFKVQSNRAYCANGAGSYYELYTQDTFPTADYDVIVDVVWLADSTIFTIEGRRVDLNNGYRIEIDQAGNWYLYRFLSGAASIFTSGTVTVTAGVALNIKLSMRGTLIRGFIDGVELGTGYTDSTFPLASTAAWNCYFASVTGTTTNGWQTDYFKVQDDTSSGSFFLFDNMFTPGLATAGDTSNIKTVLLRDPTTGAPITGLVFGDVTCYTYLEGEAPAARTLVTMTLNAFTSLGFKEIDATNLPGLYQFCPSNADITDQGHRRYVFAGDGIGILDLPIFGSDALDASVTADEVGDDSLDKALTALGTFLRGNDTGSTLSMEDSTGTPVEFEITASSAAKTVTALTPS